MLCVFLDKQVWFCFQCAILNIETYSTNRTGKVAIFLIQIIKETMPGTCTHCGIPNCCKELAYVLYWDGSGLLCFWLCGRYIELVWMTNTERERKMKVCIWDSSRIFVLWYVNFVSPISKFLRNYKEPTWWPVSTYINKILFQHSTSNIVDFHSQRITASSCSWDAALHYS